MARIRERNRPFPVWVLVVSLVAAGCAGRDPEPRTEGGVSVTVSSSASTGGTHSPTPEPTSAAPATLAGPSLVGDTRNAWAFAPLDHPERITVEGEVPRQRAWSTSKVLVVAAFLEDAADGDPARLDPQQRHWVARALGESDMDSLVALRSLISGDRGAVMTSILRSIGDEVTVAPATKEGTMDWSVGEQVRFMAALARGEVVSPATSAYLLEAMQPVPSQRWGLASVGATAAKGGWLTPKTETRQMGLLNGYAVALITDAVGPALLQSDGDEAHIEQLDRLAAMLAERLDAG